MKHTHLSLAHSGDGKAAVWTSEGHVKAGSRPLGINTTGKVRVREQVWLYRHQLVSDPTYQAVLIGGVDVTH